MESLCNYIWSRMVFSTRMSPPTFAKGGQGTQVGQLESSSRSHWLKDVHRPSQPRWLAQSEDVSVLLGMQLPGAGSGGGKE